MQNQFRRFIVLSGDVAWCRDGAMRIMSAHRQIPWLGEHGPVGDLFTVIRWQQARNWLGRQTSALVYDAHDGFDADLFCALSATVIGGGILCLLTPPLLEWPTYSDPAASRWRPYPYGADQCYSRFLARLSRFISEQPLLTQVRPGDPIPTLLPADPASATEFMASADQKQAILAAVKAACGHGRRPLVLISDRGRGKSTALAMAAAQLLQSGKQRILVTAHHPDALVTFFQHAVRCLPHWSRSEYRLHHGQQELRFLPLDHLVHHAETADLLLVDEAAAIPVPVLEALLHRYNRIAFATTEHGYEGAGRGFTLKFSLILDRIAPHWRRVRLSQPMRWKEGDPLEQFVNRVFLLGADSIPQRVHSNADELCSIEQATLADNEALLAQLFSLLQLAHYQTRPADLRLLLDHPDLFILVVRSGDQLVAAMLLSLEGGFDDSMAQEIYQGKRRPHGHMLPQTLATHAGFRIAATLRYLRIMRIAVHPDHQGRGLGSRLLEAAMDTAQALQCDFIGALFGVSVGLLSFWGKAGFLPIRVGTHRGSASGHHSVTLLKPIGTESQGLFDLMRHRFCTTLPLLLIDPLDSLDWQSAAALLFGCAPPLLDEQDLADLTSFAYHQRDFASAKLALHRLCLLACSQGKMNQHSAILVRRLLQNRPWQECALHEGITGQQAFLQQLRTVTGRLITTLFPQETR